MAEHNCPFFLPQRSSKLSTSTTTVQNECELKSAPICSPRRQFGAKLCEYVPMIADTVCGPKASIQPGKSDQIGQIERKTLFRSSNVSLAGTPDKRSSRLQARLGMVVAPCACGNYRSLMAMAPAGACVRLYTENF